MIVDKFHSILESNPTLGARAKDSSKTSGGPANLTEFMTQKEKVQANLGQIKKSVIV